MKNLIDYINAEVNEDIVTQPTYVVNVVDDKGNSDPKNSAVFNDEKKASEHYKKTAQALKGKKGYKVQMTSTVDN